MKRYLFSLLFISSLYGVDIQWHETILQNYDRTHYAQVVALLNGTGSIHSTFGLRGIGVSLMCERGHHALRLQESCTRHQVQDVTFDILSALSVSYHYYLNDDVDHSFYFGAGTGYTLLMNVDRSDMTRVLRASPHVGCVLYRYSPIRVMVECQVDVMRTMGDNAWLPGHWVVHPALLCSVGFTLW